MKRVCITGAGGYIGSWVVKLLLSKGYMVNGTVRDPCDETKNGHLKKLENAEERLHLFKADLLDFESLCAAFAGCSGVLHVASPVPLHVASNIPGSRVPNPQVEILDPAILGTQNVLNACLQAKVEKVVVVSSGSAVLVNPKWPPDMELDESCWTDIEYANSIQDWYGVSKTTAEMEALNFGKQHSLTVVTICPSLIIGPMLQSTINATSLLLLSYIKGEGRSVIDTMENLKRPYTDVRDLSEAILLLYENPESNGRYVCSAYSLGTKEVVAKMQSLFPGYNYPTTFIDRRDIPPLNSKKLLKLGWNYRPLEETIVDTIKNYEETGLMENGKPFPSMIRF
ncbi:putative NAD-dependent epimerase/dehydratase, NAD(P)-binding domain superfamily [Helianthus annuus]|uniref:Dihydroflavonol 4-reductase n=1 Tax=Helianthus annuus TaxID=4232 RepID=A0A251SHG2_HELAN|nr:cinnamoyl-CoA reductase 2 isoform X1 [Helianthus annuus]KAF5767198.1 putative NAD-dependent epimerase/dehydratase, NAD(P)-binding domain superfamily [Helianthus annuus]KAJ0462797.1 putative NAD-dependent epimerase/dehydratase, NAD(P)-binding domain superfamily [Helianthus annuus]KAJ0484137.1 putative NAD-dependent epimerase/dehydratase, NAD(P)-binding domain superfamily [Helianthus annuus]KAJ0658440.1 putative NAD-dependent epimerase/dehydratase, NAD(P)-binding domain superfamily [Helianthus